MADNVSTKKEIVTLVGAQSKTIEDISERLVKTEEHLEKQDSKNSAIVIGVLVALVFIVGTVAVEVVLSNRADAKFYSNLEKNIYEQNLKVQDINNKIDNIKARNPYLK